jgi:PiT family inorganic phosphate transporter
MHFFQHMNFGQIPYLQLTASVWLLILLALAFDFLNGLHDAANSVATVVSTRVLSPRVAVLWAAFFNFMAFLVFPLKVAATIQKDVINPEALVNGHHVVDQHLIAATLIAACTWNLLTWYWGLPTSSSHALIGGMVGAAITATGDFSALRLGGLGWIMLFIAVAPVTGFLLGSSIAVAITWICRHAPPLKVDSFFRRGQFLSAAFFSLGHGGNDAQKTMGIIFALLLASGALKPHDGKPPSVPTEVVLACHLAMGVGTMLGGWRIVKTMGQRIIKLRPIDGFCAETAAAITLATTTSIGGIPISTTHTISGAIVGVGSLKRLSAVRWGVAGQILWAWILTIPGAAAVAAFAYWVLGMMH